MVTLNWTFNSKGLTIFNWISWAILYLTLVTEHYNQLNQDHFRLNFSDWALQTITRVSLHTYIEWVNTLVIEHYTILH